MAILNNPMGALAAVNRASGITTSVRAKAPPGRAADGGGDDGGGGGSDNSSCEHDDCMGIDCRDMDVCKTVDGDCKLFVGVCVEQGGSCVCHTEPSGQSCKSWECPPELDLGQILSPAE